MKKQFTILALFTFCFIPTFLWCSTCTWTGGAGDNNWNTAGNWDCGSVPTASDDAIFSATGSLIATSNVNINTLTIDGGLTLLAGPGLTFTANTISFNRTVNGIISSAIRAFLSTTVSTITLNAPNLNLISLELNNATLNGAVNTNAQSLILKGSVALNAGCSFSGGTISGNGVEFNNATVSVNSSVSVSSAARFIGGVFGGIGSFTLGNGTVFFGGALPPTLFNVPLSINNTLSGTSSLSCANVVFANSVTLNASLGSLAFASTGTLPLEFKGAINSNKSFSVQGNIGSIVKFTNATVDIDGTTFNMQVPCDAIITNSTFNDNVSFTGNTDFYSGIFNQELIIGATLASTKTFNVKSGGIKKFLGFTSVYNILNWEFDNIEKSAATQIIINSSATLNITGTTKEFLPADGTGVLINDGTINANIASIPAGQRCNFNIRTWNRNGTINVQNRGLFLKSVDLGGTVNIALAGTLFLGGLNQTSYIQSTTSITGTGSLAVTTGSLVINQAFNLGGLNILSLQDDVIISGTGSITIPATKTMFWYKTAMQIPVINNGTLNMLFDDTKLHTLSSTLTNNGTIEWNGGDMVFNNGTLQNNGLIKVNLTRNETMRQVSGTTNIFTNCGTTQNLTNTTVNINVPFQTCPTAGMTAIKGVGTWGFLGPFNVNGLLQTGLSPGTLTINPSITSTASAIFEMEIIGGYGAAGIADDADKLESTGNIALNGTLKLILNNPAVGTYTIFNSTGGTVTGSFSSIQYSVNGSPFFTTPIAGLNIVFNSTNVQVIISQPLPVELMSFKAINTEGGNLLTWQTANEINTSHFDIERSNDGIKFNKISELKAQNKAANYNYLDKFNDNETVYYRLTINDLDGKINVSKIVSIENKNDKSIKITRNTEGSILIETNNLIELITITNPIGQVIKSTKDKQFLINDLNAGIYIISVKTDKGFLSQKIFKQ